MNQRISDLNRQELWLTYKKTYLTFQKYLLDEYEKTKDKDFLTMIKEVGETYQTTKNRVFGNIC